MGPFIRICGCVAALLLTAAAPVDPAFNSCTQTLSDADSRAADQLAKTLIEKVKSTLIADVNESNSLLETSLEDAIEKVLENSDASPAIGRAAIARARTGLTTDGLLCAASNDVSAAPRSCDAVRRAFDLATTAARAAGLICAGAIGGGPQPLGQPPPSGGGGQGGGVTHPAVAPPV